MSDIRSLRWCDINTDEMVLNFTQSKTGVVNRVPLNNSARELLGVVGDAKSYVFRITISQTAVNKALNSWMKRAGITKRITFHCARHTFIANVLMKTGNFKLAGALAGHVTTKNTERYAHVIDTTRRDAVNSLDF